jgi:hypothetical protein
MSIPVGQEERRTSGVMAKGKDASFSNMKEKGKEKETSIKEL